MTKAVVRLLLIHGSEEDFLATQKLLEDFRGVHFNMEWIGSYRDGLDAIRHRSHDAYLIDSRPDVNGAIWLLREATRAGCVAPIIVFVSGEDGRIELAAMHAGASDCLIRAQTNGALLGRVVLDVLKRSELLARLQDREDTVALLAAMVESSHDAIISKTLDGIITSWNRSAERLYGYSADESLGSSITRIIPPDRVDEFELILARVANGERIEPFDTVRVRKDGRRVPVSISISPIRDSNGRIVGASKTAHDITDRRRAQERRDTQYEVTRILSECQTLPEAAPLILGAVCSGLGWDVGQFWTTDNSRQTIRRVGRWRAEGTDHGSSALDAYPILRRGVCLPGRVWERGQPQWVWKIERLPKDEFPRLHDARDEGFYAAFAFPITQSDSTTGVLEFFTRDSREPDPDLINASMAIGRQIGQFTEHTRTESTLRETEEQLRLILDSTAEGIYGIDLRGVCTFCNPAAARLLGYQRPEDLLGKNMHDLAHHTRADGSPYPETECRAYESFRTGEGVHIQDEVFWRADGTSFPAEYFSHPIRKQDAVVGSVVAFQDITERQRTQHALERSEARFRMLVEGSSDGVVVVQDGVIREANKGFAEIFGVTVSEVVGRPAIDFASDEFRDVARHQVEGELDGSYELVGKRKDGSRVLLEVTARNHDVGGRRERVASLRDVTEKRLLENQLRQAQKMEAVGRLAGGVAHDFNNLLTVITSYVGLLLEDIGPKDPRREDIGEIGKAANAAADLTRQLLAFSRQQVIEPRVVVLEEIVASSQKMLARLLGEDIELVTTLAAGSTVRIDRGQLEQVIVNLAVNARDAMPTGGKITIETEIVDLDDEYAKAHWPAAPGRFAMLAVSDTGAGMDAETQARIFEPFFTTKAMGSGTGLGLATVYGIVKQSGGFIWVYSEPGQGSTFKVYFPFVGDAASGQLDVAPAEVPRGAETILLLEDSPSVRVAACGSLRRYGYNVLEAARASVAIDIAIKHRGQIHLLLTDVVMPEMSGRLVAERLTELRPDMRVLYMSGYTADAVVRHGVLSHGLAYLQKPFSPDTLARRVRDVLNAPRQS